MSLDRRGGDSVVPGLFWLLGSGWALAWVFWAQDVAGMAPCALCFWERWPYRALMLVGCLGLLSALLRMRTARILRVLACLILLWAMAVSFVHVGVEQGWWPSPLPECAAPHFTGGSFADRLASMPMRPAKPCDSPNRLFAWLPLSMTTLDLLYAAFLLVVTCLLPLRPRPGPRRIFSR